LDQVTSLEFRGKKIIGVLINIDMGERKPARRLALEHLIGKPTYSFITLDSGARAILACRLVLSGEQAGISVIERRHIAQLSDFPEL
jgi:hypothetical protein